MSNSREATLVVVSSAGLVRGEIGPLTLPMPWWQESGPLAEVLPGALVLRLLRADPERTDGMGGEVTYLVELDGPVPPLFELRPNTYREALNDHPLRQPWARVGGPTADVAWVASHVEIDPTRTARQERSWNLSAIWSIPILDDDGRPAIVWLKCVPPFFGHESAVLHTMADRSVPQVLAGEGHRILMADMPGYDGYTASADQEVAMVDSLVDIQLASVDRVGDLLAAGVPDLRTPRLVDELRELVRRIAAQDSVLGEFVDQLPERLQTVDAMGMPDVLAHGDPHGGNCRIGVNPPVWFDWGDSLIGNPLLDVAALHRMSGATVQHWLDRWGDAVPGSDPHRVWQLLKPVALLRMAWVYQRFCDNIEPAERVYHAADVDSCLNDVRRSLAAS